MPAELYRQVKGGQGVTIAPGIEISKFWKLWKTVVVNFRSRFS